ncbi:MAG: InlB B-repeat-containing protein [Lachnospiraceae bacterium]|nr:InlB B-repeat-containing protein [Lachnospiraceae bacterium]
MLFPVGVFGGTENITVSFESYGGNAVENVTLKAGDPIGDKLPKAEDMKRAGYDFTGWYREYVPVDFVAIFNDGGSHHHAMFRMSPSYDVSHYPNYFEEYPHIFYDVVFKGLEENELAIQFADVNDRRFTNLNDNYVKLDISGNRASGYVHYDSYSMENGVYDFVDINFDKHLDGLSDTNQMGITAYVKDFKCFKGTDYEPITADTVFYEDTKIYAAWAQREPETYTVTFDTGGIKDIEPQKVEEGKTAKNPGSLSKEGYDFAGWFLGDKRYDFSAPVFGDITLTPQFTEKKQIIDKVPFVDATTDNYANSNSDNLAPVVTGSKPKITKLGLSFDKVKDSDVSPTGLKMTVIKGTKFTLQGKLKDKDSFKADGVKVKVNKKKLTATITCKKSGEASFTMEDGNTYKVKFTVETPKAVRDYKKIDPNGKPLVLDAKKLFGTNIDAGTLSLVKYRGSQATLSENAVTIVPAQKDKIKLTYKYLNKTYKYIVKVNKPSTKAK